MGADLRYALAHLQRRLPEGVIEEERHAEVSMDGISLPELTKRLVDRELSAFCQRRVPAEDRDRLRLIFKIRGASVTLVEEQASRSASGWLATPIAQFRFDHELAIWTLYSRERSGRWREYSGLRPSPRLGELLAEVDRDPAQIFWKP